jgi:hypothetical protein
MGGCVSGSSHSPAAFGRLADLASCEILRAPKARSLRLQNCRFTISGQIIGGRVNGLSVEEATDIIRDSPFPATRTRAVAEGPDSNVSCRKLFNLNVLWNVTAAGP